MMLVFLTMFGFFFVVSQLFQLVLGYGPFESGLRMLPIMPMMIIFSTVAAGRGRALRCSRRVVIPGMPHRGRRVRSSASCTPTRATSHVLAGMVVMALGMAFTMTPMTELIMSSVPPDKPASARR